MPDSLLIDENVKTAFEENKDFKKITIWYQPGSVSKRTEYYISKSNGYISRVVSVVKSSSMYDASVRSQVDDGSYVIVEVKYSNYQERAFNDSELSTSRYYRLEGSDYVPGVAYEGYKIFLGSVRN